MLVGMLLNLLSAVTFSQIAVRAGGFSALVVVGMAVLGIAILYSTFYVWLGVDSTGAMKVTDCKFPSSWLTTSELTFSFSYDIFLLNSLTHKVFFFSASPSRWIWFWSFFCGTFCSVGWWNLYQSC